MRQTIFAIPPHSPPLPFSFGQRSQERKESFFRWLRSAEGSHYIAGCGGGRRLHCVSVQDLAEEEERRAARPSSQAL